MRNPFARALTLTILTAIMLTAAAGSALACGGLVTPNGTINLLKTTTLAAYHDGIEHYVTSFEFAGEGRRGRLDHPAPGRPHERDQGRRLDAPAPRQETQPPACSARGRRRVPAEDRANGDPRDQKIDALDITVLEGRRRRRSATGRASTASSSRPTRPRCSTSTPSGARSSWPPGSTRSAPRSGASTTGDGTPIHVVIPTPNPWVPLRILALGRQAADASIEADVYLLTDRRPETLPPGRRSAPTAFLDPEPAGTRSRRSASRRRRRCSPTCAPTRA